MIFHGVNFEVTIESIEVSHHLQGLLSFKGRLPCKLQRAMC